MAYLSKYGVARKIRIPMVKRGVVDHAVSADWTPAAGDVKISKDGGATANVTNLPTAIAMGNSTIWEFSITATEMQAAQVNVTIADTATKVVEDSAFDLETYGNASAQHAVDLADSVRAGLTALPNAAAEAAGGLFTRGTGAGQINQANNGQVDANAVRAGGTTVTGRDIGASVLLSSGTGTGQLDFTSGVVKANLAQILGTAITETAGQIAAAFKKFFDKATPTGTINSLPDAVAGASGGVAIVGSNVGAATSVSGAVGSVTGNVGGNVTGSVGSVVGAVGSVTGAVGSVTGLTASDVGAIKTKTDFLPSATAGAAGGVLIAGSNAATTFTGAAASGATPATAGLTLVGGAASTTGGGVSAPALKATGGAGAASTNGAAAGVTSTGGGTTTVSGASGAEFTGTGNLHGASYAGAGSGDGQRSRGGATGIGIDAIGGATSGHGMQAYAPGAVGNGFLGTADNDGDGIAGLGFQGITGEANSTNGNGINGVGKGAGAGIQGDGGLTGNGIAGGSGATSGDGIVGVAQGTAGHGIVGRGIGAAGDGVRGEGAGTGSGLSGVGGTDGHGVSGFAGLTSGAGIFGQSQAAEWEGVLAYANTGDTAGFGAYGSGSGPGILAINDKGGATGDGIKAVHGDSGGADIVGQLAANALDNVTTVSAIRNRLSTTVTKTATVQADGGNSATQILTNLTETEVDHWAFALVKITSGALSEQVRKCTGYDGAGTLTFASGFTDTPANGVTLELIND